MERITITAMALTVACSSSDAGPVSGADAAGFRSVVHESRALYETVPRIPISLEARVCGHQGEECQLRQITAVARAPNGDVWITDGASFLRTFDRNGRFVRSVGRTGSGPGEFRTIMALGVDQNGSATIFDIRALRVTRFDSTGAHAGMYRAIPPRSFAGADIAGRTPVFFLIPGAQQVGDSVTASFVYADSGYTSSVDGDSTKALARVRTTARTRAGSDLMPIPIPFAATGLWDVGADGSVVFSPADRFTVLRFEPPGTRSLALSVAVDPRPVTKTELDSARDALLSPGGRRSAAAQYSARVAEIIARVPPKHAVVTALRSTVGGWTWVRSKPLAGADSVRWDVYSRNGEHAGYIVLPVSSLVADGQNDELVVIEHDSLGAPSVAMYRFNLRG